MKQLVCICTLISFFFSYPAHALLSANCLNDKGKYTGCTIDNVAGALKITYQTSKYESLNRTIPGNQITKLSGGEYSRRRVAESVVLGVLVAPIALFGLFSKKKRDIFGVEYMSESGMPDSTLISVKKKYGMSVKTLLQTVSGKNVEYEETTDKKKD